VENFIGPDIIIQLAVKVINYIQVNNQIIGGVTIYVNTHRPYSIARHLSVLKIDRVSFITVLELFYKVIPFNANKKNKSKTQFKEYLIYL
jgi:hypothetical protein